MKKKFDNRLTNIEDKIDNDMPSNVKEFYNRLDDPILKRRFRMKYLNVDETTMFDMVSDIVEMAGQAKIKRDKTPVPDFLKPGFKPESNE